MKQINYEKLRENIDEMINVLEYDGSRSPGKIKINAENLMYLLQLKEHYAKAAPKKTPNKEG